MAAAPLVLLVLAAGASSRMRGADKLLEQVGGAPLIAAQVAKGLASGLPVIVTLPPDRPQLGTALDGVAVQRLIVTEAAEGLGASIRAGVAAAPEGAAVMILLADLPEITADDLVRMVKAHRADPKSILRATAEDGRPGHPIVFPVWARPELVSLQGDNGGRDILRRHAARVRPVALPGRHAVTDLDTPEDWAAWRAGQQKEKGH